MTSLVLGTVGAVAGFAIGGPAGAQLGFTIGSTLGSIIDRPDGPSPGDLSAPDIQEGHQLVRPYGTVLLTVHPVSVSDYTATANPTGGKGGPPEGSAGYTYTLDMLGVIAQRVPTMPLVAITRVWVNKKLVETRLAASTSASLTASAATEAYTSITLYPGGSSQTPPPEYETRVGTANASAYRNVATVEIIGLNCGGSKTPPLVEVECITAGTEAASGALEQKLTDAAGITMEYPADSGVVRNNTYTGALVYHAAGAPWKVTMDVVVPSSPVDNVIGPLFLAYGYGTEDFRLGFYGANAQLSLDTTAFGDPNYTGPLLAGTFASIVMEMASGSPTALLTVTCNGTLAFSDTVSNPAGSGTLVVGVAAGHTISGTHGYTVNNVVFYGAGTAWTPGTANLKSIVDAELALNPAISLADHDTSDLAAVTVRGFKAAGPPGKTIAELGDIFYFDCVPANPIKYVRRGAAVVGTIANVDTGVGVDEAGSPYAGLKIGNDVERPSVIGLSAPNASADHEPVFRRGDRLTTEGPDVQKVRTEVGLTPSEVQGRALAMSLMARASGHTAEYGLSDKYAAAEPGDAYYVYDDQGNLYNKIIRSLTYQDGVKNCKWELNDTSALVETGITDATYTPSLIVEAPATTTLLLLDIPILRDADDDAGFYAVASSDSSSWPGATLYSSADNVTYTEVGKFTTTAITGTASTALGDWPTPWHIDNKSSVTVSVNGTLSSYSFDDTVAGLATPYLIGSEIVYAMTATLVSAGVYTLTNFIRALKGTESFTSTHAAGDRFVVISTAGFIRVEQGASDLNVARYYKVVTNGRTLAGATAQTFTNTGIGLKPYAPVDLQASRSSAGIELSFNRRTRLSSSFLGTTEIPLGESTEQYSVDVNLVSGGALVRTFTATAMPAIYTAAMQSADGLASGTAIRITIAQVNETRGNGYTASVETSSGYASVAQLVSITLGGTFATGVVLRAILGSETLTHTTIAGDVDLPGAATAFAAAIDASATYTASAVGAVITVSGMVGVPYAAAVDINTGSDTIAVAITQTAAADSAGTRARFYYRPIMSGTWNCPIGTIFTILARNTSLGVNRYYTYTSDGSDVSTPIYIPGGLRVAFSASGDSGLYDIWMFPGPSADEGEIQGPIGGGGWEFIGYVNSTEPTISLPVTSVGNAVYPATTARPQISTATVAGTPATGWVYRVTLGGVDYSYTALSTDTTPTLIATGLAAVIDAAASYAASSSGGVITITHSTNNVAHTISAKVVKSALTVSAAITQDAA